MDTVASTANEANSGESISAENRYEWHERAAFSDLPDSLKAMAGVLLHCYDESAGVITYGYEAIRERAGICRRTAQDRIRRLRDAGWLEIDSKPPRVNHYRLTIPAVSYELTRQTACLVTRQKACAVPGKRLANNPCLVSISSDPADVVGSADSDLSYARESSEEPGFVLHAGGSLPSGVSDSAQEDDSPEPKGRADSGAPIHVSRASTQLTAEGSPETPNLERPNAEFPTAEVDDLLPYFAEMESHGYEPWNFTLDDEFGRIHTEDPDAFEATFRVWLNERAPKSERPAAVLVKMIRDPETRAKCKTDWKKRQDSKPKEKYVPVCDAPGGCSEPKGRNGMVCDRHFSEMQSPCRGCGESVFDFEGYGKRCEPCQAEQTRNEKRRGERNASFRKRCADERAIRPVRRDCNTLMEG